MDERKSSISQAHSYIEIGEFWDTHDVTDYWEQTRAMDFDVNIQSEITLCALEPDLATQASRVAQRKGISLETLINLWVRDKLEEEVAKTSLAT